MASDPSFKIFPIDNWYRKQAFEYFKDFKDPFFNITANVDVTHIHKKSKAQGTSFFLLSLYISLKAVNHIDEFKLRFLDDQIVLYDTIDGGCTILFENHSFGFGYFEYKSSEQDFIEAALVVLEKTKNNPGFDPRLDETNLIHHSSIPWVSFTSFEHAKSRRKHDAVPKIVFGKYFEEGGKVFMPISVSVNHAFADGYHVGRYFELFHKFQLG